MTRKKKFYGNPKNLPQLLESAAALGESAITGALDSAAKWWKDFPKRIQKAVKVKA